MRAAEVDPRGRVGAQRRPASPQHADPDLLTLADRGDPGTIRLLTDMGIAIGRVVATPAASLDPALVIVGGAIATDPLVAGVSAAVRRYTQPYVPAELRVVPGTLGVRASLLGAVALAVRAAAAG